MATLTWRDVANPQLRAPDTTEAMDALARGVAGFGQSVKDLAMAPEQRRQADLASQMLQAQTGQKFLDTNEQRAKAEAKEAEAARERAALKAFGAAQSVLEAKARETALSGKSFDDFLKSDAYLALDPDARSFGAAHLSDAFSQGQTMRDQRLERERAERHWQASYRLQVQAAQRAERQLARALGTDKKPDGVISKDPETNRALGNFRSSVMSQLMEATGYRHEKSDLPSLAKGAGIDDYSEFLESFATLNKQRVSQGKVALPEGVMKMVLAGQSGKNNWPFSMVNEVDQDIIDRNLALQADVFDAALKQEALLHQMEKDVANGLKLTDPQIQAELQRRQTTPARVAVPGKPGVSMPARVAAPTGFQIPMKSY